jgi:hypothetical protein
MNRLPYHVHNASLLATCSIDTHICDAGAFDERSMPTETSKRAENVFADAVLELYAATKGPKPVMVPGYTGYIPHSKDIAGRSQIRVAARAMSKSAEELVFADPLPADPVNKKSLIRLEEAYTREVLKKDMSDTLVGRNESQPKHIPGYTGV